MTRSPAGVVPQFDVGAGALCLDFANTSADRLGNERSETIRRYEDLLSWCKETGVLDPQNYKRLIALSSAERRSASLILQRAIKLRVLIYQIFSAMASGRNPATGDLSNLTSLWARATASMTLVKSGRSFKLSIDVNDLEYPIGRVLESAMELLTSKEVGRLRQCASSTCDWLFIDRSKNRSRRWCDMQICGSRLKSRRYYKKIRSGRNKTARSR
jgi:predicted RNA-binding Zn ribbon-like protein